MTGRGDDGAPGGRGHDEPSPEAIAAAFAAIVAGFDEDPADGGEPRWPPAEDLPTGRRRARQDGRADRPGDPRPPAAGTRPEPPAATHGGGPSDSSGHGGAGLSGLPPAAPRGPGPHLQDPRPQDPRMRDPERGAASGWGLLPWDGASGTVAPGGGETSEAGTAAADAPASDPGGTGGGGAEAAGSDPDTTGPDGEITVRLPGARPTGGAPSRPPADEAAAPPNRRSGTGSEPVPGGGAEGWMVGPEVANPERPGTGTRTGARHARRGEDRRRASRSHDRLVPAPATGPRDWAPVEDSEDDEEHFVPPVPPSLLEGDPLAKVAWLLIAGAPIFCVIWLLLGRTLDGWRAIVTVAAFISGFVLLYTRLKSRSVDEDEDDGAVV